MSQENIEIVRRNIEAWNRRDLTMWLDTPTRKLTGRVPERRSRVSIAVTASTRPAGASSGRRLRTPNKRRTFVHSDSRVAIRRYCRSCLKAVAGTHAGPVSAGRCSRPTPVSVGAPADSSDARRARVTQRLLTSSPLSGVYAAAGA